jgi:transcriptional regulator with XRE-family HTH domain
MEKSHQAIRSMSPISSIPKAVMRPGARIRNARERLGLTYRDVERASYELARQRGRPDFIVHLSRLADIENRDVTPSLYKLYTLAVIFHLDPREVCQWYEVPFEGHFADGTNLAAPNTHLAAGPQSVRLPLRFDPGFNPDRTEYLTRMVERWGSLEGNLFSQPSRYLYGYVGLDDRRMDPLLRPGSLVLVDPSLQKVRNSGWNNEYERPIYFIELHRGYCCCWCRCEGGKLILVPHPLSSCAPEVYQYPAEAEVVGQIAGVAMRLRPKVARSAANMASKASRFEQNRSFK